MEYVMHNIILKITITINNDISNNADGERGHRKHLLGGWAKSTQQINTAGKGGLSIGKGQIWFARF